MREKRLALKEHNHVDFGLAIGVSQFEALKRLVQTHGIDWHKVTLLRLNEYVGLLKDYPVGLCRYVNDCLIDLLPEP